MCQFKGPFVGSPQNPHLKGPKFGKLETEIAGNLPFIGPGRSTALAALQALPQLVGRFKGPEVDISRCIVAGHSMGGHGAWYLGFVLKKLGMEKRWKRGGVVEVGRYFVFRSGIKMWMIRCFLLLKLQTCWGGIIFTTNVLGQMNQIWLIIFCWKWLNHQFSSNLSPFVWFQRLEASHRSELGHLPLRVTNDHNDPRLFALAVDVLGVVSSASWLRKDQYADSNKVSKGDFFFMILPAW